MRGPEGGPFVSMISNSKASVGNPREGEVRNALEFNRRSAVLRKPEDGVSNAAIGGDGDGLIQSRIEDASVWSGHEGHLERGGTLTERALFLGCSGPIGRSRVIG